MKILHTEASEGWGGQEIRILDEAAGFIARGYDVHVAATANAQITPAARKRGIPVHAMPVNRRSLGALRALLALVSRLRPDVIVTHSSTDSWLVSVGSLFMRPRPAIVRLRHISGPVGRGRLNRWLYGRVPARIVTTGEAIRRMLIERLALPPERVMSVPTGTDLTRFRPGDRVAARRTLDLPADQWIVGIVATLRSWKGHRFLISAMTDPRLETARLVIVGDGPQEPHLRKQVHDLGLDGRVTFAGRQDDVRSWLHAFSVFVLPSTGNEGIPQALMQAMASELPVVTTAAGAIPELVRDHENGLVVATENPKALSDAICEIANDRALRQRLAVAARREVEQKHTKAAMLDAMEDVFRQAVKRGAG